MEKNSKTFCGLYMRVSHGMTRHLATFKESQRKSRCGPALVWFFTLTFRSLSRTHFECVRVSVGVLCVSMRGSCTWCVWCVAECRAVVCRVCAHGVFRVVRSMMCCCLSSTFLVCFHCCCYHWLKEAHISPASRYPQRINRSQHIAINRLTFTTTVYHPSHLDHTTNEKNNLSQPEFTTPSHTPVKNLHLALCNEPQHVVLDPSPV